MSTVQHSNVLWFGMYVVTFNIFLNFSLNILFMLTIDYHAIKEEVLKVMNSMGVNSSNTLSI